MAASPVIYSSSCWDELLLANEREHEVFVRVPIGGHIVGHPLRLKRAEFQAKALGNASDS